MKFRLFHRRLTISAPRVAVRSALPWPLRWMAGALLLGFSVALALWAFEVGKGMAGLDSNARQQLGALRDELQSLRTERDRAQSIANTSGILLVTEKTLQVKMREQIQHLETVNRSLRDDLGFFEKLLPAGSAEVASIRSLEAEVLSDARLRWQVLVIQPVKNAPDFSGRLDLTLHGTQGGQPWTMTLPGGSQPLQFRQFRRVEGFLDVPAQAMVQAVTVKVTEGTAVRSVQTVKL